VTSEQATENKQLAVELQAKQEHVSIPIHASPVKPEKTEPDIVVATASPVKSSTQESVSPWKTSSKSVAPVSTSPVKVVTQDIVPETVTPAKANSENVASSPVKVVPQEIVTPSKTSIENNAPVVTSPSGKQTPKTEPVALAAETEPVALAAETMSPVKVSPAKAVQKEPENEPAGTTELDTKEAEVKMETEECKQEGVGVEDELPSADMKENGSDNEKEEDSEYS